MSSTSMNTASRSPCSVGRMNATSCLTPSLSSVWKASSRRSSSSAYHSCRRCFLPGTIHAVDRTYGIWRSPLGSGGETLRRTGLEVPCELPELAVLPHRDGEEEGGQPDERRNEDDRSPRSDVYERRDDVQRNQHVEHGHGKRADRAERECAEFARLVRQCQILLRDLRPVRLGAAVGDRGPVPPAPVVLALLPGERHRPSMASGCNCIKRCPDCRREKRTSGPVLPRHERSCASNVAPAADELNRVPRKMRETPQSTRSATRSPGAITNVSAALPREMASATLPYESS